MLPLVQLPNTVLKNYHCSSKDPSTEWMHISMFVKSGNLMGGEIISLYLDIIIAESSNVNLTFSSSSDIY